MSLAPDLQDRLGGAPHARQSLRLWLRLLTCSSTVERRIAARFRDEFDTTLPRFDFMAALERAGSDGLPLGQVSKALMVTNGNVTGLANRLKADGLIEPCEAADRRMQRVRLTPEGAHRFRAMATAHAGWIEAMFSGLNEAETDDLLSLLDRAKRSLQHASVKG